VIVCKPRELVWDYTNDITSRTSWDPVITSADVIQHEPNRIIKIKSRGNTSLTCHYKHYERPHKSSIIAKDISSPWIASADGSWSYDKIGRGTLWSQIHTIELRQHPLNKIMLPFYKWYFKKLTRHAMAKARAMMEKC
jgi:hypothetical protein